MLREQSVDQKIISSVVINTFDLLRNQKYIDSGNDYQIIQASMTILEDMLSIKELVDLRNYIQEIYLLIQNHDE